MKNSRPFVKSKKKKKKKIIYIMGLIGLLLLVIEFTLFIDLVDPDSRQVHRGSKKKKSAVL